MAYQAIEYKTISVKAAYGVRTTGLLNKTHHADYQTALPVELASTIEVHLRELGQAGWELVNLSPIWQSIIQPGYGQNQMPGAGYVVPVSYLLVLKRSKYPSE
ncbi:hypothetical protein [Pseudomonas caricapapayae]|uniref:hypothetical protein n=1 Tax=Pseudomonas caricapapayae TaxID=46678 RepID=UPI000EFE44ED|nr:hypothetical protein [Pseudomonas caricapapayae]